MNISRDKEYESYVIVQELILGSCIGPTKIQVVSKVVPKLGFLRMQQNKGDFNGAILLSLARQANNRFARVPIRPGINGRANVRMNE